MARLRLSAAARRDLADICRYSLREFGLSVADTYLRRMKRSFELLRERPFAGAVAPDLKPALRVLTYRRHRIFYRIEEGAVQIIRVLHHAQDVNTILNS